MPEFRGFQIAHYRRLLWHLRQGGVGQVKTFLRRERLGLHDGRLPRGATSLSSGGRGAGALLFPRRSGRDAWEVLRESPEPFDAVAGFTQSAGGEDPGAGYTLDFLPAEASAKKPVFGDLRVATILDDFSQTAWGHEFTTVSVTPQGWREQLAEAPVDLLLVESAWAGNGRAWQYQLTGSKAPSGPLRELVTHCREQGIPTVFWNKEDPPHVEDFLETARLFDVVFTSDSRLIPRYREELGHHRVASLAFAAQPALHHPIRPQRGYHERDMAFAGMYFAHKFPERRDQMQMLLSAAETASATMARGLEIFSRFLGDDERYQFPQPFAQRVVGGLDYQRMLTAYRAYKVFLNVNSVADSPSMCARRVFEITASGTPVVSTRSEAIPRFFDQAEVPVVDSEEEARQTLRALVRSPELNARTAHLGQRRIWRGHTYAHRAVEVLEAAGLGHDAGGRAFRDRLDLPETSILVSTNRPHQLEHVLKTVAGFEEVETELILVAHGFQPQEAEVRARAKELGIERLSLCIEPVESSLGECLNRAVEMASGEVLTKVDDDDLYGPQYLADLLRAMRFSGAEVVGKQAHYMHLAGPDATLLRFAHREHRWTDFVMGPTITGRAEVFRDHPFASVSRSEDTGFLSRVAEAGGRIYSADRFNFCQMRGVTTAGHAWGASETDLLGTGEIVFFGDNPRHLMF